MKFLSLIFALWACIASAQPWQPEVIWDRQGATDSAHYGYNVFTLGDQNQDGYDDFGIYAAGEMVDGGSTDDFPRVEFYHGGNPPSQTPYFVWTTTSTSAWELQTDEIGDFNGDGYTDWMIARPDTGASYLWYYYRVYFGGPAADTIPDLTFYHYLSRFHTIGDFNGDGFDDLWRWDGRLTVDTGELYLGSANPDTTADFVLPRNQAQGQRAVWARQGDVNADGYSDGVGYSSFNQQVIIFLGSATPDTTPDYIWPNAASFPPAAIVKDLNGDGFDEIIAENHAVHYGRPVLQQTPDLYLQFPGWFEQVASAGDVNGDGFGDIAVTNPYAGPCWGYAGVYLGGAWQNPEPVILLCGGSNAPYYPRVARGAGDVNGDGVDDIIVGGTGDHDIYVGERGGVMILAGDSMVHVSADDPFILPPSSFSLSVYPNPFNSSTIIELSLPPTSSPLELTLYNTLGQVAYRETLHPATTAFRHALPAEGLASGVYILSAQAGEMQKRVKVVVLK